MSQETKKVFISYSWTSREHEDWVLLLAERLVSDGVDVLLDKWNLTPGQDKYSFMESMVTNETINKVLIICDRGYKEKANNRQGGVGTEAQIITPELYGEVNQNKFIPVIVERGESFDSYMPAFVKSRIAIDMSSLDVMEEGYRQLYRAIFDKPLYQKPVLGETSKTLLEDKKSQTRSNTLLSQIESTFLNAHGKPQYFINSFRDNFISELEDYIIETLDTPHDQHILDTINEMSDLKDIYIKFLNLYIATPDFQIETIQDIFEKSSRFTFKNGSGQYYEYQYDNIKFFLNEIFIYTCIILIDNNLFKDLSILLHSVYFVDTFYGNKERDFTHFRFYIRSLDEIRKDRLKLNRLSVTADTFLSRSELKDKNFRDRFIQTDLLLFYVAVVNGLDWFPITYPFFGHGQLDILRRLVSKRHCTKLLGVFNVQSIDELKERFSLSVMPYKGYNSGFERLHPLEHHIDINSIGTKP